MTDINHDRPPYPGGFMPGDDVVVIDGIFKEKPGKVVTPDEARALRKRNGGEECRYDVIPTKVWVAIVVFERCTPVMLEPWQMRKAGRQESHG
jgi:transcription antitermination factor NusG